MSPARATGSPPEAAWPPTAGWTRFGSVLAVAAGLHASWMLYSNTSEVRALFHDVDPTFGRPVPAPMRAALFAAKEVARQQALLSVCAAAVSVLLAAWLVVVGLGVRRGSLVQLQRARTWAIAAVAADLLWLGMRVALLPAQARAVELLRAATPAESPFGTQVIEEVGKSLLISPLLLAAALQLVAPVLVGIWATRLLHDARAPAPATASSRTSARETSAAAGSPARGTRSAKKRRR